jgi:hypothetical protein
LEKEKREMEEQIRDLMCHFEAQMRLQESADVSAQELQQSQIGVSPTAKGGSDRKRHRKKGK